MAAAAPLPAPRTESYSGGQIAGAVALTVLLPLGRLIGLIVALSLLRGEGLPERRRLLRTWAATCAAILTVEVIVALFVIGVL